MPQWVRGSAGKRDSVILIPRTHVVERSHSCSGPLIVTEVHVTQEPSPPQHIDTETRHTKHKYNCENKYNSIQISFEFKASLVYRESSRTAKTDYTENPCLEKNKKTKKQVGQAMSTSWGQGTFLSVLKIALAVHRLPSCIICLLSNRAAQLKPRVCSASGEKKSWTSFKLFVLSSG